MKKTELQPIYLEIAFEETEDIEQNLERLLREPQFKEVLKTQLFELVRNAVESKKHEFAAFRMTYYGIDLIVEQKHYKNLLNTMLTLFQQDEEYLKCATVQKLISKV